MSSEKARRWILNAGGKPGARVRIESGDQLTFGERVEVAEVSALRAEWEEELLSDRARRAMARELAMPGAASPVGTTQGGFRQQLEAEAGRVVQAGLAAIKEERDRG